MGELFGPAVMSAYEGRPSARGADWRDVLSGFVLRGASKGSAVSEVAGSFARWAQPMDLDSELGLDDVEGVIGVIGRMAYELPIGESLYGFERSVSKLDLLGEYLGERGVRSILDLADVEAPERVAEMIGRYSSQAGVSAARLAKIDALSSAISTLTERQNVTWSELSLVLDGAKARDAKLVALEASLAGAASKDALAALDARMTRIEEALAGIGTRFEAIEAAEAKQASELAEHVKVFSEKIAALEVGATEKTTMLSGRIDQLVGRVDGIASDVMMSRTDADQGRAELDARLTSLSADVRALVDRATMYATKDEVAALEAAIATKADDGAVMGELERLGALLAAKADDRTVTSELERLGLLLAAKADDQRVTDELARIDASVATRVDAAARLEGTLLELISSKADRSAVDTQAGTLGALRTDLGGLVERIGRLESAMSAPRPQGGDELRVELQRIASAVTELRGLAGQVGAITGRLAALEGRSTVDPTAIVAVEQRLREAIASVERSMSSRIGSIATELNASIQAARAVQSPIAGVSTFSTASPRTIGVVSPASVRLNPAVALLA
jgi:hypothetical protein